MTGRCACGWRRPLIALVVLGAPTEEMPPVVPAYNCPECGAPYVSQELPETQSAAILEMLAASLALTKSDRGRN